MAIEDVACGVDGDRVCRFWCWWRPKLPIVMLMATEAAAWVLMATEAVACGVDGGWGCRFVYESSCFIVVTDDSFEEEHEEQGEKQEGERSRGNRRRKIRKKERSGRRVLFFSFYYQNNSKRSFYSKNQWLCLTSKSSIVLFIGATIVELYSSTRRNLIVYPTYMICSRKDKRTSHCPSLYGHLQNQSASVGLAPRAAVLSRYGTLFFLKTYNLLGKCLRLWMMLFVVDLNENVTCVVLTVRLLWKLNSFKVLYWHGFSVQSKI